MKRAVAFLEPIAVQGGGSHVTMLTFRLTTELSKDSL